jgi:hypothetical protein
MNNKSSTHLILLEDTAGNAVLVIRMVGRFNRRKDEGIKILKVITRYEKYSKVECID